jgi:glucokinase
VTEFEFENAFELIADHIHRAQIHLTKSEWVLADRKMSATLDLLNMLRQDMAQIFLLAKGASR